LNALKARLLGIAQADGLIRWNSGAFDGSFPLGKGGGGEVRHGHKGKGILIHLVADAEGMPVSG